MIHSLDLLLDALNWWLSGQCNAQTEGHGPLIHLPVAALDFSHPAAAGLLMSEMRWSDCGALVHAIKLILVLVNLTYGMHANLAVNWIEYVLKLKWLLSLPYRNRKKMCKFLLVLQDGSSLLLILWKLPGTWAVIRSIPCIVCITCSWQPNLH